MDTLDVVITIWMIFFSLMAISWFLFTRISIPRIDRQMEGDKKPRVCPVDIFGIRALMIANAISLPLSKLPNPIIDNKTVQPYGTRFDKRVALILSISTYMFGITAVIGGLLLPGN